ncbi:hypothetical protein pdam_00007810 [Pocillopora damicornis]|uniref:Uncharacterized protein n=1 Tax=Pocillopora damicornis TaxID=46731 RepID=A0A3M6TXU7_POCDA|nr:hypothetical protein pdam_00007810 [Pocillopora damicornis]
MEMGLKHVVSGTRGRRQVVLVHQKKKLINAAFVYPLYAENKDSSHNGKSTKNNVRQPAVFRQVNRDGVSGEENLLTLLELIPVSQHEGNRIFTASPGIRACVRMYGKMNMTGGSTALLGKTNVTEVPRSGLCPLGTIFAGTQILNVLQNCTTSPAMNMTGIRPNTTQNKGYLLYTENKNSSCYGKCTENDVRQPVVFRQRRGRNARPTNHPMVAPEHMRAEYI